MSIKTGVYITIIFTVPYSFYIIMVSGNAVRTITIMKLNGNNIILKF